LALSQITHSILFKNSIYKLEGIFSSSAYVGFSELAVVLQNYTEEELKRRYL